MKKVVTSRYFTLIIATILLQLGVLGVARFDTSTNEIQATLSGSSIPTIPATEDTALPDEDTEQIILEEAEATKEEEPSIILEEPVAPAALNKTVEPKKEQIEKAVVTEEVPVPQKVEQRDPQVVTYKVRSGDTLTSIWSKNSSDHKGAFQAAQAFKKAGVTLNSIRAGETLTLRLAGDNTIEEFQKDLPDGKKMILTRGEENSFQHKIIHPVITEKKVTASGTILRSLSESATRNNVPAELVDDFVDLFGGRVEFSRDLQPGDRFSVIYKERTSDNGMKLHAGPIESASLVTGDDFIAIVRYEDSEGNARYYDEQGEPIGSYFLRYPLRFTRISSVFSRSRFHPVLKRHRPHNGVDFAAPTGTPVRSVADGIVIKSGYAGGAGNMVKIKHSGRYSTAYLHLSKISRGIKKGTRVKRGQVIGKVGSTGYATGPHLHYSLYDYGKYVDPMKAKLPKLPADKETIPNGLLRTKLEALRSHHEKLELASIDPAPETHET